MAVRICCVVEGHGDYKATPILIRRVASEIAPEFPIEIPQPVRVPRSKLTKTNELEKAVLLAVNKALPHGAVLILADSDDDPPRLLGPELLKKAMQIRPDVPIGA